MTICGSAKDAGVSVKGSGQVCADHKKTKGMPAEADIPSVEWVLRAALPRGWSSAPGDYWIGPMVPAMANGSPGGTPDVSCHTVIVLLVANAR